MGMVDRTYTGTEWSGGFFAFIGLFWVLGAVAIAILVMIGSDRAGTTAAPVSNETPVANSPQTE
jgi:hypothetical protein